MAQAMILLRRMARECDGRNGAMERFREHFPGTDENAGLVALLWCEGIERAHEALESSHV